MVAVVVAGLAASCSGTSTADVPTGDSSNRAVATDGSAGGEETTTTITTTTARGPEGSGQAVTLAFAGDSNFDDQVGALRTDPAGVLGAIAPVLSGADLTFVNLEAALGSGGSPQPKAFTFQVPAQALDALRAAGVDGVTMANNHGMDFGAEGLQDSLRIKAESGFPVLGIGADEDQAYAPLITEVKGQRIGVIAANDIFDDPLRTAWTAGPGKAGIASAEEAHQERLLAEVRATRDRVDTLVVFLHYGTEKQTCPNPRQQDLARALTAAGADIVVGGHAHRVQGAGYLGGQLVAYGLGNFIFQANSPEGASSGVLVVTATGRRIDGYQWKPAVIRNSLPVPLTGAAESAALATMDQRRDCAGLTATPTAPTAPAAPGPTTAG
jgi:poly-gamma-glutamate synthesis protein (capsule biosynthesis protein)